MEFYPGFEIVPRTKPLDFIYGDDVFGPRPVIRTLEEIRSSLADPACAGPETLYCIAMDVGLKADRAAIAERNLLFGAVTYAAGTVGDEAVRSQGHSHAVSPSSGCSTPEVYEIWDGEAVIYMQESGEDDAGRCFAIRGKPGDVIVVPPGWVHAAVNADPGGSMTFGAWCVRDYGFDYAAVRRHGGIAYFPKIDGGGLRWQRNPAYESAALTIREARDYPALGLEAGVPIYRQFRQDMDRFDFVVHPDAYRAVWEAFEP